MPTNALLAMERAGAALAGARPVLRYLMVGLVALVLYLPGFASLPVTDRDEARFVVSSRQMVDSGNFVDIRFQDEPRNKKPVGIYWAQSMAAIASGQGAEAPLWVWRMPSLIGAVSATMLVIAVGAPLVGAAPATMAALIMAASLVLGGEARIAKTDAVLLATILGMMAAVVRLHLEQGGRRLAWLFWTALALSVLVKGPIGPLIVGLAMAAASLWKRSAGWLRPLVARGPILLAALVVLPWFVAITWRTGGGFWMDSVGQDMMAKVASGQEGKGALPGTYLAGLWASFWPGGALLAASIWALWRRRSDPAILFLFCWLVPGWVMFEFVPTKLIHYTMPLYPALALMIASAMFAPGSVLPGRRAAMVALLPALVGPLLLATLIWIGRPFGAPLFPGVPLLVVGLALAWLGVQALARGLPHAAVLALVAAAVPVQAGLVGTLAQTPLAWPSEAVMSLARRATGCAAPQMVGWGYEEPSLVWLGGPQTRLIGRDALPPTPQPCMAVARLAARGTAPPNGYVIRGRIEGFALGAGREVGIDVLTAPSGG